MKARIALLVTLGMSEGDALNFLREIGEIFFEEGKETVYYDDCVGYSSAETFEEIFDKQTNK